MPAPPDLRLVLAAATAVMGCADTSDPDPFALPPTSATIGNGESGSGDTSSDTGGTSSSGDTSGSVDPTYDQNTVTSGSDPVTATSSADTGSTTTGGAVSSCDAFAMLMYECWGKGTLQDWLDECYDTLDEAEYIGQDCVDAYEDWFACIGALDCGSLEGGACPDEGAALETLCKDGND